METAILSTISSFRNYLSATVSHAERERSRLQISQIKESKECLEVVINILHSTDNNNNDIKLMSLSLLYDWMLLWWNRLDEREQHKLRLLLLNDFLLGSLSMSESRAIRNKVLLLFLILLFFMFSLLMIFIIINVIVIALIIVYC